MGVEIIKMSRLCPYRVY